MPRGKLQTVPKHFLQRGRNLPSLLAAARHTHPTKRASAGSVEQSNQLSQPALLCAARRCSPWQTQLPNRPNATHLQPPLRLALQQVLRHRELGHVGLAERAPLSGARRRPAAAAVPA